MSDWALIAAQELLDPNAKHFYEAPGAVQKAVIAALRKARSDALEEAEIAADDWWANSGQAQSRIPIEVRAYHYAGNCIAAAIRALKEKQP